MLYVIPFFFRGSNKHRCWITVNPSETPNGMSHLGGTVPLTTITPATTRTVLCQWGMGRWVDLPHKAGKWHLYKKFWKKHMQPYIVKYTLRRLFYIVGLSFNESWTLWCFMRIQYALWCRNQPSQLFQDGPLGHPLFYIHLAHVPIAPSPSFSRSRRLRLRSLRRRSYHISICGLRNLAS